MLYRNRKHATETVTRVVYLFTRIWRALHYLSDHSFMLFTKLSSNIIKNKLILFFFCHLVVNIGPVRSCIKDWWPELHIQLTFHRPLRSLSPSPVARKFSPAVFVLRFLPRFSCEYVYYYLCIKFSPDFSPHIFAQIFAAVICIISVKPLHEYYL